MHMKSLPCLLVSNNCSLIWHVGNIFLSMSKREVITSQRWLTQSCILQMALAWSPLMGKVRQPEMEEVRPFQGQLTLHSEPTLHAILTALLVSC
jgi:hypothetical protein